jgi:hypothetical protein
MLTRPWDNWEELKKSRKNLVNTFAKMIPIIEPATYWNIQLHEMGPILLYKIYVIHAAWTRTWTWALTLIYTLDMSTTNVSLFQLQVDSCQ